MNTENVSLIVVALFCFLFFFNYGLLRSRVRELEEWKIVNDPTLLKVYKDIEKNKHDLEFLRYHIERHRFKNYVQSSDMESYFNDFRLELRKEGVWK